MRRASSARGTTPIGQNVTWRALSQTALPKSTPRPRPTPLTPPRWHRRCHRPPRTPPWVRQSSSRPSTPCRSASLRASQCERTRRSTQAKNTSSAQRRRQGYSGARSTSTRTSARLLRCRLTICCGPRSSSQTTGSWARTTRVRARSTRRTSTPRSSAKGSRSSGAMAWRKRAYRRALSRTGSTSSTWCGTANGGNTGCQSVRSSSCRWRPRHTLAASTSIRR